MSQPVKGGRRAEQARATRRRIVDCAHKLFLEQGYAPTTLDQIATRAGVAVQTVYFHFGNKRTVLKEVMDVLAVGDDAPVPLLDRDWVRHVRDAPDLRAALAIWIDNSRVIYSRVAPMMSIVRDAAGVDPEMAEQFSTNQNQRYLAHSWLTESLTAKASLRPDATDIIFTLLSPEVYLLMTVERGWTPDRWQHWVIDTIAASILAS